MPIYIQSDLHTYIRTSDDLYRLILQLLGDWVHQFASAVGKVLDSGRRVMVYSGKEDYICNYVGGAEWTNATKWKQEVCVCVHMCSNILGNGTNDQYD